MIKTYLIPAIIFALGIYSLTEGRKRANTASWMALLISSGIIWFEKSAIEMLLFLGLFTPVLYVAGFKDVRKQKARHSSIQEKATAYVAVLPTFGFYFLFKDKIENHLIQINVKIELIKSFELMAFFLTLIAIYSFLRSRGRQC